MSIALQAFGATPMTDRQLGRLHFDDIVAARRVISRELTATPLVAHPLLSRRLGAEVHVKLESALPLGSFKVRGGLNYVAALTAEERARGLVTASRGNHGQSLAHAARNANVPCVVYVPRANNNDKNLAIAALGARVEVAGHDFDAAWDAASAFAEDTGAIAVHPSRETKLVAGYATVALEMLEQATHPIDTVFVPVGGGSLAAGIGLVYKALSPHTRVIGVQSEAAPALSRAWRSGELVEYPVGDTIADGLAARRPSAEALNVLREVLDDVVEVSEAEIAGAIRCYAETLHQLAEGAGAAALAGAMRLHRRIAGQRVAVVLSGGNITADLLVRILHGEPHTSGDAQINAALANMEYGMEPPR